ncbi:MAG: GNAT family N-acetyltransferase [Candidatus Acidiferrales bacterium]
MRIQIAESPEFIPLVRELFVEYSESLGVALCFQGFAVELAGLPGEYARPAGRLFLALDKERATGCGALRRIDEQTCEMKRLYVRPAYRGKGVGREMIDALMNSARAIGYGRMRLDTLPSMTKAIALYRALGFREISPYRANPVPGALFFECDL